MSSQAPAPGILITVNGEPREVHAGATIESLLVQMSIAPQTTATALNGEFVPRAQRTTKILLPGDSVTCFQPITGG